MYDLVEGLTGVQKSTTDFRAKFIEMFNRFSKSKKSSCTTTVLFKTELQGITVQKFII